MGFSNYLIKIKGTSENQSDYVIPLANVMEKTYKGTYSTLDTDSGRNGSGKLVRRTLPHKVPHCSIEIRPLDNNALAIMMGAIQDRYTKPSEKKVLASIWVAEINNYVEMEMYVPDIDFTIRKIDDGKVFYEPFTLEFIGY